jgi:hypothetical protein
VKKKLFDELFSAGLLPTAADTARQRPGYIAAFELKMRIRISPTSAGKLSAGLLPTTADTARQRPGYIAALLLLWLKSTVFDRPASGKQIFNGHERREKCNSLNAAIATTFFF